MQTQSWHWVFSISTENYTNKGDVSLLTIKRQNERVDSPMTGPILPCCYNPWTISFYFYWAVCVFMSQIKTLWTKLFLLPMLRSKTLLLYTVQVGYLCVHHLSSLFGCIWTLIWSSIAWRWSTSVFVWSSGLTLSSTVLLPRTLAALWVGYYLMDNTATVCLTLLWILLALPASALPCRYSVSLYCHFPFNLQKVKGPAIFIYYSCSFL